jgi:hypothetical protein
MKKDGTSKKQLLSEHQGGERMPDWGNDFSIIYQGYIGITHPEIIKMDSSGNNLVQLTENSIMEYRPQFSPNNQYFNLQSI